MQRQSFYLLLALLLLFTQQLGIVHLASHAAAQVTHQQGTPSDGIKDTVGLCQQCSMFASLSNSPVVVAYIVDLVPVHVEAFAAIAPEFKSQYFSAYRSRAPPAVRIG